MNKIALTVENLTKIYSKNKINTNPEKALNNLSFDVKQGEIFGLLGPNGAGKTTFLSILGGLVTKSEGNVKVWGFDLDKNPRQVRASIGIVPQEVNLDAFFSPKRLLELQAGLYGVSKDKRITEIILKLVSLENQANSYSRSLSGGMKRRLLIAKAMVHQPPILVLDEPTAGVDVELRTNLWKNIEKLNSKGKTIIITTHYLHEAEELCNEIAIIDEGKLIAHDSTSKIKSFIDNREIKILYNNKDSIDLSSLKNLNIDLKPNGKTLEINYKPSEIKFNDLLKAINESNIDIEDISIKETRLEDVFLKLTQS